MFAPFEWPRRSGDRGICLNEVLNIYQLRYLFCLINNNFIYTLHFIIRMKKRRKWPNHHQNRIIFSISHQKLSLAERGKESKYKTNHFFLAFSQGKCKQANLTFIVVKANPWYHKLCL